MALKIGDTAPDFEAESTEARIRFHEWVGDGWAVLFSHHRPRSDPGVRAGLACVP
jgi:alkyl hydroperoxide reductase subunit AhpC